MVLTYIQVFTHVKNTPVLLKQKYTIRMMPLSF